MKRRRHARDRIFERRLAALRADYQRIAPDPTFVARVGARVHALERPSRVRKQRRALAFAASVLVAFVAGFLGALGASPSGSANPTSSSDVLSLAPRGPASPPPHAAADTPKAVAERLRALLSPLGTPAASDPATLAAWRRATRDPDPTLRAVARALLRASEAGHRDGSQSGASETDEGDAVPLPSAPAFSPPDAIPASAMRPDADAPPPLQGSR